jgi:hypothetical protein
MLSDLLKQLGMKLQNYADDIMAITLVLISSTIDVSHQRDEQKDSMEIEEKDNETRNKKKKSNSKKQPLEIRSLCFQRFSDLLDIYSDLPMMDRYLHHFIEQVKPLIHENVQVLDKKAVAETSLPSNLLDCFIAISRNSQLATSALHQNPYVIYNILNMLSLNLEKNTLLKVLDFIENMIYLKKEESSMNEEIEETILSKSHITSIITNVQNLILKNRQASLLKLPY